MVLETENTKFDGCGMRDGSRRSWGSGSWIWRNVWNSQRTNKIFLNKVQLYLKLTQFRCRWCSWTSLFLARTHRINALTAETESQAWKHTETSASMHTRKKSGLHIRARLVCKRQENVSKQRKIPLYWEDQLCISLIGLNWNYFWWIFRWLEYLWNGPNIIWS